jgi:hypothetical protein
VRKFLPFDTFFFSQKVRFGLFFVILAPFFA